MSYGGRYKSLFRVKGVILTYENSHFDLLIRNILVPYSFRYFDMSSNNHYSWNRNSFTVSIMVDCCWIYSAICWSLFKVHFSDPVNASPYHSDTEHGR